MIPCPGEVAEARGSKLLFMWAGAISMKGLIRGAALVDLSVREHGGLVEKSENRKALV